GVQPITSQTFYLLDSDAEEILKSSVKNHHPGKFGFLSMFGFDAKLIPNSEEHKKALAAIEQHTKYSATTDLHGKAHFTNVRAGAYYIFGFAETRGGYAVWNLNVSLKEGANSQILDAKNAAVAL